METGAEEWWEFIDVFQQFEHSKGVVVGTGAADGVVEFFT